MIIHKFTEIIGAFDVQGVPAIGLRVPTHDPARYLDITYLVLTALMTKKEWRTFPASEGDYLIFTSQVAHPELPRDEQVWALVWQARKLFLDHDPGAGLLLQCTRRGLRKLVANIGPQENLTLTLPDYRPKVRLAESLAGEPPTPLTFIHLPTTVREQQGAPAWELLHRESGLRLYPQGRRLMGCIWDGEPCNIKLATELLNGWVQMNRGQYNA